jgi:hypothetical protein
VTGVDADVTDVTIQASVERSFSMGMNQYTAESPVVKLNLPLDAGVYRIRDTVTGAEYIGSSKCIRYRISQHFYEIKTGGHDSHTYATFKVTYAEHGFDAFEVDILLLCSEQDLVMYEKLCISAYTPSENSHYHQVSEQYKALRSACTTALWQNPEYRANAIAARKGKAYNKGYKCTPEQVANRRRAGRISTMKRKFGVDWQEAYRQYFPEHVGDLDGYSIREG